MNSFVNHAFGWDEMAVNPAVSTAIFKLDSTMRTLIASNRPVLRRGLSREESAVYLGVSASKFDQMRADGRVGPSKLIDGRKIWDVRHLDDVFENLPSEIGDDEDWKAAV
jgi:hypothetical protein